MWRPVSRVSRLLFRAPRRYYAAQLHKLNVEFSDERVYSYLKHLTGMNFDKIFKARREGLTVAKYQLMADEELKKAHEEAVKRAETILEMPAVEDCRKEIDSIIEEDAKLENYDDSPHVFVDISMSATDRDRHIVVREVSGTLRHAKWKERDRMNQIYFPKKGRRLSNPWMLTNPYLTEVLKQGRHVDVLDLCNLQFEPDHPHYIKVHHMVYDDLLRSLQFDVLHSTRHFGGFVWYLLRTNQIDAFVKYLVQERKEDLPAFVDLYCLVYPLTETAVVDTLKEGKSDQVVAFLHHKALSHLLPPEEQTLSSEE